MASDNQQILAGVLRILNQGTPDQRDLLAQSVEVIDPNRGQQQGPAPARQGVVSPPPRRGGGARAFQG